MEPRARASRHKGQLNFGEEIKHILFAYGAPSDPTTPPGQVPEPYPETLRVLDEMLTDFIIEICHSAVSSASYAGRQKLKGDDFQFALRKDPIKLGRVQQMYLTGKDVSAAKKAFNAVGMEGGPGERGGKFGVEDLAVLGEIGGEEGTGKGKGRGRGRKRKERVEQVDGLGEGDERLAKRPRSEAG